MKVVAVVPASNEAQVIGAVIGELRRFVDTVVVVDDGSTDQTADVAEKSGAVVVRHRVNRGQGAALQTGIAWALQHSADVIVTFDADGQHAAEDVPRLVEPLMLGRYDVALGSRFNQPRTSDVRPDIRCPAVRRWLLKLATVFDRLRTGLAITDTHNGLRAFSRRAAELITIRQDGMAHASEILDEIARHQLRFTEVPVAVRYTPYARAKGQGMGSGFSILRDLLARRFLP